MTKSPSAPEFCFELTTEIRNPFALKVYETLLIILKVPLNPLATVTTMIDL